MNYKFEPVDQAPYTTMTCPCCGQTFVIKQVPFEEEVDPNQLSFDFDEVENV